MNTKNLVVVSGLIVVLVSAYVALALFQPCTGEYEFNLKEGRFTCKPVPIPTPPKEGDEKITIMDTVTSPNGFKVVLDGDCPSDSPGYSGENDPMGTLRCGNTYTVVYNTDNAEWVVSGHHENSGKDETHKYSNANPKEYKMSLWGRVFTFDQSGNVQDPEYGKVGRIISK